jgi:hypothetical protein
MPHLNDNGIVVLQPTAFIDGKNFIKTILLHESGESIEALTEIIYSKQNDAQSQGSGITYARRYGLQSLVNVGAEDDDGNKASNNTPPATNNEAETPKITTWLTEEQFKAAMASDKKGIVATLTTFNGLNGKGMKKDFNLQLTQKLSTLKDE